MLSSELRLSPGGKVTESSKFNLIGIVGKLLFHIISPHCCIQNKMRTVIEIAKDGEWFYTISMTLSSFVTNHSAKVNTEVLYQN